MSENDAVFEEMVFGTSPAMLQISHAILQIAQYPAATVLLQGESGTGKDVVARAIHFLSSRGDHPLVPINCAAIPETLLETELFGVESGAYTDARVTREGYVYRANGGTLFLDEISSMPLVLQAKLLRFLETRSFRRVGSTKEIHVDLRVISASNVDLLTAVKSRTFREDLYYRLNVFPLNLPPLRERQEDIEPLVMHFLQKYSREADMQLKITPEAMELLKQYSWPGNIRELRSAIQRGQILCTNYEIQPVDLPPEIRNGVKSRSQRLQEVLEEIHLPPEGLDLHQLVDDLSERLVREALDQCTGNQVRAAALLHISRDQLRYIRENRQKRSQKDY
ncbi:MAG TPA: sigma-54 dependent transcriptional regulator [Ktedonobacteraceae bacterium]|nr:sigma-54 dependent transcriptional regulator [Ktedonobacteraceae bacterium]